MLIPVVVVGGVTVAVVDVVDVVAVGDGLVATAVAMVVAMVIMGHVGDGRALVPVVVVDPVDVAVVEVIGVVVVGHAGVPAVGVVHVGVGVVDFVIGAHGWLASLAWLMASPTMWATCSSVSE